MVLPPWPCLGSQGEAVLPQCSKKPGIPCEAMVRRPSFDGCFNDWEGADGGGMGVAPRQELVEEYADHVFASLFQAPGWARGWSLS